MSHDIIVRIPVHVSRRPETAIELRDLFDREAGVPLPILTVACVDIYPSREQLREIRDQITEYLEVRETPLPPIAGSTETPTEQQLGKPSLDPELDAFLAEGFPVAEPATSIEPSRYEVERLAGVRRVLWSGADVV